MPLRSRAAPRGLTLIELLITIAIAALLLSLAMPAMQQFVTQKAVASNSDELLSALRFARSEALKRSAPVTVCSGNGQVTAAAAQCGADTWSQGWLVFADVNGNGSFDKATDQLLRVQQPLSPAQVVGPTASGNSSFVEFVASGIVVTGAKSLTFKPTLKVTDANYNKFTRTVCVNAQGRANLVSGTTSCN